MDIMEFNKPIKSPYDNIVKEIVEFLSENIAPVTTRVDDIGPVQLNKDFYPMAYDQQCKWMVSVHQSSISSYYAMIFIDGRKIKGKKEILTEFLMRFI